jgi:HEAT repeat protein
MRSTRCIVARLSVGLFAAIGVYHVAAPLFTAFGPSRVAAAQPAPMDKMPTPPSINEVDGRGLDAWLDDLKEEDAGTRLEAVNAIMLFTGPHGSKVVDALLARAAEVDSSVRIRACIALTIMEFEKGEIPKIVKAMGQRLHYPDLPLDKGIEPQSIVRFHAATCLYRYGDQAQPAIPNLAKFGCKDPSSYETRRLCLKVLEAAGYSKDGPDTRAIEAMLSCAEIRFEKTATVRVEAIIGLGSLGRTKDQMLNSKVDDVLKLATKDKFEMVAIWAYVSQMALDKVNDDGVKKIISHFKSTNRRARREAINAIALLNDKAKIAIPALIEQLNDRDSSIVISACAAIGYMGAAGKPAVPALIDRLSDKNLNVVVASCTALAMIGKEATAALEPLKALTDQKDVNPFVKAYAEGTIKAIKGEKPANVKAP